MNDLLIAEAMLGQDAQEFLSSELGRYLLGRADQEKEEAIDQLKRISPWRKRRITELQNAIWRAESIKEWIVEMIQTGQAAEHALELKE